MNRPEKARKVTAKRERGVVTAEFALLLPLFVLIIAGLIEGGHLWHLKHTITNASREGARAAIVYRNPYSQAATKQTAITTVNNYLQNFLPHGTWQVDFPTEPPASYTAQAPVTVRVTTTEGLMLLDKLVPAFENINVEASTTMKLE